MTNQEEGSKQEVTSDDVKNFYTENHEILFGYAISLTRNKMDAEDMMSEIYMELIKKTHSVGIDHLKRYLSRCIRNEFFTQIHRAYERNTTPIGDMFDIDFEAPEELEEDCFTQEDKKTLEDSISEMAPMLQRVFHYHLYDRMTHKEIAFVLGRTEGSVRGSHHRAYNSLRKSLKKRGIEWDGKIPVSPGIERKLAQTPQQHFTRLNHCNNS